MHTNLKVNDVVAVHIQAVKDLPALCEPLVQVVEAQQQLVEAAGTGLFAASLLLQQAGGSIRYSAVNESSLQEARRPAPSSRRQLAYPPGGNWLIRQAVGMES